MITLALACSASLPAQVQHRDLKSGRKQIRSLVLMPIQVHLTRVSLKGAEPMNQEARDTELPLTLEIEAVLRDLGYQLDVGSLSNETLAKDADQRYTVDDLQKKFDAELQLMHRKSKGVRRGRFTLGDDVVKLPLRDSVDALLFVRARGQVLTGNKRAFDALAPSLTNDTTLMDFGLVDARTGDVLYFAKSKMSADIQQDSEEVAAGIARAFMDLPKITSSSPPVGQIAPPAAADGPVAATEAGKTHDPTTPALPSANAPASGMQARRLRLSHVVLKGMLIRQVAPEYPEIASMNHVEGEVVMRVVIDRNGQVGETAVVSGPAQLIPAATSAVKQWRYRPFTVNGQVFEVETQIVATFKIGR